MSRHVNEENRLYLGFLNVDFEQQIMTFKFKCTTVLLNRVSISFSDRIEKQKQKKIFSIFLGFFVRYNWHNYLSKTLTEFIRRIMEPTLVKEIDITTEKNAIEFHYFVSFNSKK